jgi:CRISPR/Cas system-associated exonuclease Cas4 (RecB family)
MHDSAVNVTSLAVYADCPRKYYLQRYIGWNGRRPKFDPEEDLPEEQSESTGLSAADLGSAVHEILSGAEGAWPLEAQRLANVFQSSPLGRRASVATRSEREWNFIVDIEGTLVRGSIDLWFEDSEIVIVDYKTDDVTAAEAGERASTYRPQLALYAIAIERALGKRPARACLHFLRPDRVVEVPVDGSAIDGVIRLLGELRQSQEMLRFDLHEAARCRSCPFYRGLCPATLELTAESEAARAESR